MIVSIYKPKKSQAFLYVQDSVGEDAFKGEVVIWEIMPEDFVRHEIPEEVATDRRALAMIAEYKVRIHLFGEGQRSKIQKWESS